MMRSMGFVSRQIRRQVHSCSQDGKAVGTKHSVRYTAQIRTRDFVPLSSSSSADELKEKREMDLPRLVSLDQPKNRHRILRARANSPAYLKAKWEGLEEVEPPQQQRLQHSQNPYYQPKYDHGGSYLNNRVRKQHRQQQEQGHAKQRFLPRRRKGPTVATYIRTTKEEYVPRNEWVVVTHIPPVSTLETMVEGINTALDRAVLQSGGILNLEAAWHPDMETGARPLPMLTYRELFPHLDHDAPPNNPQDDLFRWVHEARVVLSSFGRPTGWKFRMANRSIAHALFTTTKQTPLKYAWKVVSCFSLDREGESKLHKLLPVQDAYVRVSFAKRRPPTPEQVERGAIAPIGRSHLYYDELDAKDLTWIDDSVVRVENCDDNVCTEQDLLHVFSRYDLKAPSILRWIAKNPKGQDCPTTFLVRFASASWARAAIRDKQGTKVGAKALLLVPFPKQLIPASRAAKEQKRNTTPAEHESVVSRYIQEKM